MSLRLSFHQNVFTVSGALKCPAPGFVLDRTHNLWFTSEIRDAAPLRAYADDKAKKEIYRRYITHETWGGGRVPIPKGLSPLPFQKPAIRFVLERNRSYLWNDMGTGKGPTIAMAINALTKVAPISVLYVCPPELTFNVEAELNKWLLKPSLVAIFNKKKEVTWSNTTKIRVLILPDTMLAKISEDALKRLDYSPIGWRQTHLVVDEAHRYKNIGAARTKALFGHRAKGEGHVPGLADRYLSSRITYMTGTAMPNGCPLELFPVLSHSAPETIDFAEYYSFAFKYTQATESRFGWRFENIKNEEEFRQNVYGKFLFRLKKDVLGLPKRVESALVVAADMKPELAELDRKILRRHSPEDLMRRQIHIRSGKIGSAEDLHLMTYRRLLGKEKVAPLLPVIKTILEDSSVLIFAVHTEVIDALAKGLEKYRPVVIDGRIKKRERHEAIEEFKRDPAPRPLIGNIRACGIGFTILKCTRVLFVEWDWVPGTNDQGADRTHRIGQTRDVYIQYALFRNSIDRVVLDAIFRKRNNTKKLEEAI